MLISRQRRRPRTLSRAALIEIPGGLFLLKPRTSISGHGICKIPTSYSWQRSITARFMAGVTAAPSSRAFWLRTHSMTTTIRRLRLSFGIWKKMPCNHLIKWCIYTFHTSNFGNDLFRHRGVWQTSRRRNLTAEEYISSWRSQGNARWSFIIGLVVSLPESLYFHAISKDIGKINKLGKQKVTSHYLQAKCVGWVEAIAETHRNMRLPDGFRVALPTLQLKICVISYA